MTTSGGCRAHEVDARVEIRGSVGTWHLDLTTGAFATNPAARELFGWPASGPSPTLQQYLDCVHPDDAERVAAAADRLVRSGEEYTLEHRAVLPGGRLVYLRAIACADRDDRGRTLCLHGMCVDVTDLAQAVAEAERARALARSVLDTLPEGYLLISAGTVLEANAALCRLTGFEACDVEGAAPPYPFGDPHSPQLPQWLAALTGGGSSSVEGDIRHRDGSRLRVVMTATDLPSQGDLPLSAVLVRDVTAERSRQHVLEREADTDELTGLPNSRTFRRRLRACVTDAAGAPLTLGLLDLDRFKNVNDRHGHAVGDQVLVEASRRMRGALDDRHLLARIGGEEFAVLLPALTALEARQVLTDVLDALRGTPFTLAGTVTASVGIGQLLDGMSDDELFRLADHYLYEAKEHGRNQIR